VVIAAARPGAGATEYSPIVEDQKGLLTARIIDAAEAAAGEADGRDGTTVADAFEVATREMTRLSAQAGFLQTPALFASDIDPKAIRFPRAAR
jgi:hypothetical protein